MHIQWSIFECEYDKNTGAVFKVNWSVSMFKDQQNFASSFGVENFFPNVEDSNFVPYSDLTEEIMLQWVWAKQNKEEIEQSLLHQINTKDKTQFLSGLPWLN